MKTSSEKSLAEVWRGRVREWRASGETAEAFVQGRGYAPSTLRSWASRLREPTPSAFVRLLPKATPALAELVVEVGAARVRVTAGFDPSLLAAVVAALTVPR